MKTLIIIIVAIQLLILVIEIIYFKRKLNEIREMYYKVSLIEESVISIDDDLRQDSAFQRLKFHNMEYRYRAALRTEIKNYKNKCKKDKTRKLTFKSK